MRLRCITIETKNYENALGMTLPMEEILNNVGEVPGEIINCVFYNSRFHVIYTVDEKAQEEGWNLK